MMYKYEVIRSAQFNRELKRAKKRGFNIEKLDAVVDQLRKNIPLEQKYHDHDLQGEYKGFRECHISSDWLLIYIKDEDELILFLARTGTHSDLFD